MKVLPSLRTARLIVATDILTPWRSSHSSQWRFRVASSLAWRGDAEGGDDLPPWDAAVHRRQNLQPEVLRVSAHTPILARGSVNLQPALIEELQGFCESLWLLVRS